MRKKNKHLGSSFDDFLKEQGIFEETIDIANKRAYVFQLEKEMKKQNIGKAELAENMETSRSQVDRVLDPKMPSTLKTLAKAANAVGRKVAVMLV